MRTIIALITFFALIGCAHAANNSTDGEPANSASSSSTTRKFNSICANSTEKIGNITAVNQAYINLNTTDQCGDNIDFESCDKTIALNFMVVCTCNSKSSNVDTFNTVLAANNGIPYTLSLSFSITGTVNQSGNIIPLNVTVNKPNFSILGFSKTDCNSTSINEILATIVSETVTKELDDFKFPDGTVTSGVATISGGPNSITVSGTFTPAGKFNTSTPVIGPATPTSAPGTTTSAPNSNTTQAPGTTTPTPTPIPNKNSTADASITTATTTSPIVMLAAILMVALVA